MEGCIVETKANGYGKVRVSGRLELSHRMVYEQHFGAIPEGMIVHHKCENKSCTNPQHLALREPGEHVSGHKLKMYCVNGHPLAGENLYHYRDRVCCKECRREKNRLYRARRRMWNS